MGKGLGSRRLQLLRGVLRCGTGMMFFERDRAVLHIHLCYLCGMVFKGIPERCNRCVMWRAYVDLYVIPLRICLMNVC